MAKLPYANKDLGQHFLRDQKVINTITSDWKDEADVIVEVGPGPGILTHNLSQIDKNYFVIEKDARFKEILAKYLPENHIFITDALEFDWNQFIEHFKLSDKKIWLVSNLPYNVGTVLFTKFLKIKEIKFMSLMFQKEVGEKTYLRDTKNQMNGLLFLSLNYFEPKQLLKVSPGAFSPPPKVDSVVVSYQRKDIPDIEISDFDKLNRFTRALFSMKRKQIQKVLKSNYSTDQIARISDQKLLTKRAEALNYQEVLAIFNQLG